MISLAEFESIMDNLPTEIRREEIPRLLGRIEEFKAKLQAVLFTPSRENESTTGLEPDSLITVEEAAEMLKLTRQYLYGLLKSGDLAPVKCGKYVRIRISDLNAWIENHIEKRLEKQLYHRYSTVHEPKRTVRGPKVARSHSNSNGGPDRSQVKHSSALGKRV